MYELLGISIGLAALLAVNAVASVAVAALWRVASPLTLKWSADVRARVLFALRVFPSTAAILLVVAFFIPSYLKYEPWPTREVVGVKLALVAALSALSIALALWRGLATWRATRRLVKSWMRRARSIDLAGLPLPAHRIPHQFPVIAVTGVLRPRLFVADSILESLNEDELRAAVAHEIGHLIAFDNLKRWLMRMCRDVLTIIPTGRSLDRAWAESAEVAADERAARAERSSALDLASALIKIARMAPPGAKPSMPLAAFLTGDEAAGTIAQRVLHLGTLSENGEWLARQPRKALARVVTWTGFGVLVAGLALAISNTHALAALHASVEQIVALLN